MSLPNAKFQYIKIDSNLDGSCSLPVETSFADYKGKIVITGAPAAFSPTCSISHIPGYIEKLDELLKAGVEQVFIVTADNPFANGQWAKSLGVTSTEKIKFVTDAHANFSQSLGFGLEVAPGVFWASRYLVIADGGKITYKAVEERPGSEVTVSSVENALSWL